MVYQILYYLVFTLLVVILILLLKWFKSLPQTLKYLFFLMLSHLVVQLPAAYILEIYGSNSMYYKVAYMVYILCEFGMFYYLFSSNKNRNMILSIFSIGTAIVLCTYIISFQDIFNFSEVVLINNLMIVISSLIYYWNILKKVSKVNIFHQWEFLLVSAFFFHSLVGSCSSAVTYIALAQGTYYFSLAFIKMPVYIVELSLILISVSMFIRERKLKKMLN